jgi:hypothetical protein
MTEEIKQVMTELTAIFNNGYYLQTHQLPSPSAIAVALKLLLKTKIVEAYSWYTGPDWKDHLIMLGDTINVHVYINEGTDIGFHLGINLGGQFPVDIAKKTEPQPVEKAEIFVFISGTCDASTPSFYDIRLDHY